MPRQSPTLPRGREGANPLCVKIFLGKGLSARTSFVLFDCVDKRILMTSERDLERQGRPSRGTPTPPGYGYLTHHLPRKVTHAWISDSAIEQVLNARVENDFPAFDYIDSRILRTSKSTRKRQGRPSRGTPTPPGYEYLTHHPP